jgi:hypothetical protein
VERPTSIRPGTRAIGTRTCAPVLSSIRSWIGSANWRSPTSPANRRGLTARAASNAATTLITVRRSRSETSANRGPRSSSVANRTPCVHAADISPRSIGQDALGAPAADALSRRSGAGWWDALVLKRVGMAGAPAFPGSALHARGALASTGALTRVMSRSCGSWPRSSRQRFSKPRHGEPPPPVCERPTGILLRRAPGRAP